MRNYDNASTADFYTFVLSAGNDVELRFSTGTDTSTVRHMLGGPASFVHFLPDAGLDCQITKINGRTLRTPLAVTAGGFRTNKVIVSSMNIVCNTALTLNIYAER